MPIRCEIVSQDRMVFQGDADMVILPGAAGEMGVLEHHAPVLTTLKFGVVRIRRAGTDQIFAVAGGVAEVQPDLVTVLARSVHGSCLGSSGRLNSVAAISPTPRTSPISGCSSFMTWIVATAAAHATAFPP